MRWIVHLFERFQRKGPPPPPEIDHAALRDEMTRTDPALAHVRNVAHEAAGVIAGKHAADQLRDRFSERIRDSWRPPHDPG